MLGAIAGVGALLSSAISIGGANKAAKAQKSANKTALMFGAAQTIRARQEEQRIFDNTKAEDPSAKIEFGTGEDEEEMGSYNDFLTPVAPTATQNASSTGLGGLGFGTQL